MLISSSPSRGFLFIDPALIGNMCDDLRVFSPLERNQLCETKQLNKIFMCEKLFRYRCFHISCEQNFLLMQSEIKTNCCYYIEDALELAR